MSINTPINTYNITQEDVCIWFKSHLEGHSRIELMCSLLDICLPLELRFLGTYLEYAAGKHHAHLQKWGKDANNPTSFLVTDLSDATTRRRLCLFLTLLHSHNKAIATKLFDVLSLYENLASLIQISSVTSKTASNATQEELPQPQEEHDIQTEYDSTSWNEFKLLLTLSSLHPAFSFNQRLIIREKLDQFIALTDGNTTTSSFTPEKTCEPKSDVKSVSETEQTPPSDVSSSPPISESQNTLLLATSATHPLPIPGNVQKQGLLPTPLLQIHELHYPQYIPVPGSFAPHPGQPILIPSSNITVINQDQMMCVQSAPNVPINMNNNPQQFTQNVTFHKVNPIMNKSSSGDVLSQALTNQQQDVILNSQFTSFHHDAMSNKRNDDVTIKQPVLINQNHVSPFQIINNNFHHHNTNKMLPTAGDIHSNWRSNSVSENMPSHQDNSMVDAKKRPDMNPRGSVSDLQANSSDLGLVSRRSYSETDVCETSSANNTQVLVPSHAVMSDTTVLSPNNPNNHRNNPNNTNDFKISYKSKLVGAPYTHVPDAANVLNTNQSRPILIPKNLNEINNIGPIHPNSTQLIAPIVMHKLNQLDDNNVQHSSVSSIVTTVLGVSQSYKESVVSSMSKLISPHVYISADKQTIPTGINGGYLQNPVESYNSNTTVTVSENHPRLATNPNHLFAETNIHKISPISIQVHRKSVSTNNNHILSPSGAGSSSSKFSSESYESPVTSPSHSPRRSPYSSPSNSPMSHRKDYSNSKHLDAYSSASNWLKSLRLHKYSSNFEGYTFQRMKDLTDDALADLITTKGAQTKFKQNVEQLVKRGFKEFGCLENATINEERSSPVNHVSPASDVSPNNKLKNADASLPNEIQSYLLSPAVNSHIDMNAAHAYPSMHSNYYNSEAMNEIPPHPSKAKIQENSPLIRSGGFFEDISGRLIGEPYIDDEAYDEVITRKQNPNTATCYNCGAKGHYGHQCIEPTMEAQTYSRYAFQLDFSRRDSFTNTEPKAGSASISSR